MNPKRGIWTGAFSALGFGRGQREQRKRSREPKRVFEREAWVTRAELCFHEQVRRIETRRTSQQP